MYPNHGYRKGELAEQYASTLFGALEIQKKKALQAKCRLLEDNIKELDEDVQEIRKENSQLTEKCSLLELQVLSLQQNLKIEEQKSGKLKTEIIDNQKTIKDCNKIINAREKEILRYKADLERLKQQDASDGITNKLYEIFQRFVNVNEVISRETRALAEEIKMQHREEKKELLQNMQSDYERCKQSSRNLIRFPTDSDFTELLEKYRTLCEINDSAAKALLKVVYKRAKTVDHMRERWETFIKHHLHDLLELEQFEKSNAMLDATSLKRSFQIETQMYDMLTAGDEEGNWSNDKAEEWSRDIPVYVPCCQYQNNPNSKKKKRKNRCRKPKKNSK